MTITAEAAPTQPESARAVRDREIRITLAKRKVATAAPKQRPEAAASPTTRRSIPRQARPVRTKSSTTTKAKTSAKSSPKRKRAPAAA